ncbi:MAG: hypothetical protein ACYDCO_11430 [Armatimonadota bacterium]
MFLSSPFRALPVAALIACLVASLPVVADITLGTSARSVAMGGAGIASGDAQGAGTNPAFLADSNAMLGIIWPSVSAGSNGAAGLLDAVKLITNAAVDSDEAWDMLKEAGEGTTTVEMSANAGLALPRADLLTSAAVHTEITPNADFSNWLKSGASGDLPATARADVYAGGTTSLPSLGIGFHLPALRSIPGKTAVGFRVKPSRMYYSHYVFDPEHPRGTPAEEMGGKSYLASSSFSADAGIIFTPQKADKLHLALMVNNLVEPKAVRFRAPSERFGLEKQLAPLTVSVGSAWEDEKITLAVDLVDITGNAGESHVRAGCEYRLPGGIAIRGGYNSRDGFTGGIGLGALGIAISKEAPVMISNSISF